MSVRWYRYTMGRAAPQKAQPHATRQVPRNDDAILQAGNDALRVRLGTEVLLRFLVLVGGGSSRFEDARKTWIDTSLEDFERLASPRQEQRHRRRTIVTP